MTDLIKIRYVGKKPFAFDNVAGSGKCWSGAGDVQEVSAAQARSLLKYPDQWAAVDAEDAARAAAPVTVEVTDEDGQGAHVDRAALAKPLEKMSKTELVALAQAKFGKRLDARKSTKHLIDAIEEFERDLEPIGPLG